MRVIRARSPHAAQRRVDMKSQHPGAREDAENLGLRRLPARRGGDRVFYAAARPRGHNLVHLSGEPARVWNIPRLAL